LITETEVLEATLQAHDFKNAERFVHEVFWRTYFKGWLEQHPTVWPAYQAGLRRHIKSLEKDRSLAAHYGEAVAGETGIDCFDAWAQELAATGYLHNHARMWFASIWVFTLRLPWELGADFFMRHLIDGDPASNTLAWRWVSGIQTKGRPYIARVSNISKFTNRRFCPTHQINTNVTPIADAGDHLRKRLPNAVAPEYIPYDFLLLITEDDMHISDELPHRPVATIGALATTGRSPLPVAEIAQRFAADAMHDACGSTPIINQNTWANDIIEACERHQTKTVVTGYAPIGPTATALTAARLDLTAAGIRLVQVRRPFDTIAWPHATKGFFAMKKVVPSVLEKLGLAH
jgi:deoxyribodipyrimidine photo-lyase